MRRVLLGHWVFGVLCATAACSAEKDEGTPPEGSTTSEPGPSESDSAGPDPSSSQTPTATASESTSSNTGGAGGEGEPGAGGTGAGGSMTMENCGPENVGSDEPAFCGQYKPMTIPNDPNLVVASDLPAEALVAGQPYVASIEVFTNTPTIEIWGANAKCGDGVELLASVEAAQGIHCFTLEPSASYSHLLTVLRGPQANGALITSTFCGSAGFCGE